jgi:hypothetical protein
VLRVVAALELYLDQVTDRRLRVLWNAFEAAGVPSLRDLTHGRHRPHMSLVGAPALDAAVVADALAGLPVGPPLPLRQDFVGVFVGRVVWLGVTKTPELLAHHAAVHERLAAAGVETDPFYAPANWVPHVTLSMRTPLVKLTDAMRLCMDVLPMTATLRGGAVADHARGLYQPLA